MFILLSTIPSGAKLLMVVMPILIFSLSYSIFLLIQGFVTKVFAVKQILVYGIPSLLLLQGIIEVGLGSQIAAKEFQEFRVGTYINPITHDSIEITNYRILLNYQNKVWKNINSEYKIEEEPITKIGFFELNTKMLNRHFFNAELADRDINFEVYDPNLKRNRYSKFI